MHGSEMKKKNIPSIALPHLLLFFQISAWEPSDQFCVALESTFTHFNSKQFQDIFG